MKNMRQLVQMALDLLGDGSPSEASLTRLPPPSERLGRTETSEAGAAELMLPAIFRHPQANRELLLGRVLVAYSLQRSRRRTIGFTVGDEGLAVRAPSWVTVGAVEDALREKGDWILRKLDEVQVRLRQRESARVVWGDGAVLPYLGASLTVRLDPTQNHSGRGGTLVPAAQEGETAVLYIGLARAATPEQVRESVQAWLLRDARRRFTARLDHFAPVLNVQWTRLRLSSAQTRWGSARIDGSISLNWRLLHFRPEVIDYVVVHELSHLRVMDHSPRFWSTVASVLPDYAQLRQALRDEPTPQWT